MIILCIFHIHIYNNTAMIKLSLYGYESNYKFVGSRMILEMTCTFSKWIPRGISTTQNMGISANNMMPLCSLESVYYWRTYSWMRWTCRLDEYHSVSVNTKQSQTLGLDSLDHDGALTFRLDLSASSSFSSSSRISLENASGFALMQSCNAMKGFTQSDPWKGTSSKIWC